MEWLLKLFVLLICFDVFVIATCWYVKVTWPNWWERHICDPKKVYVPIRSKERTYKR